MELSSKIYVAGHTGLVGSAIIRKLKERGYNNVYTAKHSELDLTNLHSVQVYFDKLKPEYVFVAAARVGGIFINNETPVNFFVDNMLINMNIMGAAFWYAQSKKVCLLGSSCIFPKNCPTPIKEEYLMTGPLEPTNSGYAMAKIASIELAKAYRKQHKCNYVSVMPCNLYGIEDSFNLKTCHVLPALIRIFHEAKLNNLSRVTLAGTGTPKREFIHADDCAEACIRVMNEYDSELHLNIGCGVEYTIKCIAELIAEIVNYEGKIEWDTSKPDGVKSKVLDITRMKTLLNWEPSISLRDGITNVYEWFVNNYDKLQKSGKKWSL